MNPVGHPVERSSRQLCKQIWGSMAMSGVDTQVWELEVYKSSLQSAAVHAGDFTEGDRAVSQGQKLGEHLLFLAGTRRAIKGVKETRLREENQDRLALMKAKSPISRITCSPNTHSDISQYFLQCLLHSGS